MFIRSIVLIAAGPLLIAAMAVPASAQNQSWTLGAGYWSLPNVDDKEGTINTSGWYGSLQNRASSYLVDIQYALDSPNFFAVATDYIYSFGGQGGSGGAYLGLGYTYFSCSDLDKASGFNVMLGSEFGSGLIGDARYNFLGSDEELITVGLSYSF